MSIEHTLYYQQVSKLGKVTFSARGCTVSLTNGSWWTGTGKNQREALNDLVNGLYKCGFDGIKKAWRIALIEYAKTTPIFQMLAKLSLPILREEQPGIYRWKMVFDGMSYLGPSHSDPTEALRLLADRLGTYTFHDLHKPWLQVLSKSIGDQYEDRNFVT